MGPEGGQVLCPLEGSKQRKEGAQRESGQALGGWYTSSEANGVEFEKSGGIMRLLVRTLNAMRKSFQNAARRVLRNLCAGYSSNSSG